MNRNSKSVKVKDPEEVEEGIYLIGIPGRYVVKAVVDGFEYWVGEWNTLKMARYQRKKYLEKRRLL